MVVRTLAVSCGLCLMLMVCAGSPQNAGPSTGVDITPAGWRYKIKPGDTVRSVAAHFHMKPQDLQRQLNRPFFPGQLIYLNPPENRAEKQDDEQKDRLGGYLVQSGDTLESIADRLSVSTEELGDLNGLGKIAEVRAGDTLAILAKRYRTTPERLASWNECGPKAQIFEGMVIIVGWEPIHPDEKLYYPQHSKSIEYVETKLKRLNGVAANGSAKVVNDQRKYETYTAHSGDTVASLAHTRNCSAVEIRDLNAMEDEEEPKAGELLYLPPKGGVPAQGHKPSEHATGQARIWSGVVTRQATISRQPRGPAAYAAGKGTRLQIMGAWAGGYAVLLDKRGGYGWIAQAAVTIGQVQTGSQGLAPPPNADRLIKIAYTYYGVPYVFGGNSTDGIDCSAFVKDVYVAAGVWHSDAPRTAMYQYQVGVPVEPSNLQAGDRIYFCYGRLGSGVADHTAIYIGGGQIIQASRPHVRVSTLFAGRLSHAFLGARRDVGSRRVGMLLRKRSRQSGVPTFSAAVAARVDAKGDECE